VEALMHDAGITCFVADRNMSVIEGSLGILPRRIMVEADALERAKRILADAGIGSEVKKK
jgi:Putative prokaryotic signal transducing protein